jgi:hypothetical protein
MLMRSELDINDDNVGLFNRLVSSLPRAVAAVIVERELKSGTLNARPLLLFSFPKLFDDECVQHA